MAPRTDDRSQPRVAVVTVSYGSEAVLPAFLESIRTATAHPRLVAVADNKQDASPDVALIVAEAGAVYRPMNRNAGYGAAINEVVRALPDSIDWVLVSNPDVVLGDSAIDQLVATAESDSAIGAVGPRVLEADGTTYPSARAIPSLRNGIGHALFANIWSANPWTRSYKLDHLTDDRRREAGWLSGSCVLVRRSLFDALAGFDEGYFMYFEDVDLGYRIGIAGFKNVYDPAVSVTHIGAHATETESAAMITAHHASARRFLEKKYAAPHLLPVRLALEVGLSVRSRILRRRAHT